jgi:hypothetical protein
MMGFSHSSAMLIKMMLGALLLAHGLVHLLALPGLRRARLLVGPLVAGPSHHPKARAIRPPDQHHRRLALLALVVWGIPGRGARQHLPAVDRVCPRHSSSLMCSPR